MAVNKDIALNNNDIDIIDGDMYFAESDVQHVIDTINAFPGWWKEQPADGVGILSYSKSPSDLVGLNRSIGINLSSDGYKIEAPVITLNADGSLIINPNAVKI